MPMKVRQIYNLSLRAFNEPQKLLTDNFQSAIECDDDEILYIYINKVIVNRFFISYNGRRGYVPIRVAQAYSKANLGRDIINPLDRYGPIVFEYSGYHECDHNSQYHPLIGHKLNKIDFYLDLENVGNIYDDPNSRTGITGKRSVSIQYTIIKLATQSDMDRLMPKSIIVDSRSAMETYPNNKANNFRCHLTEPIDTSHTHGQPYVQLNSISIPPLLNFSEILHRVRIHVSLQVPFESNRIDIVEEFTMPHPVEAGFKLMKDSNNRQFINIHLTVPLFFSTEALTTSIQNMGDLVRQVNKRLNVISIELSIVADKIKFENYSSASSVVIAFSHSFLGAALGIPPTKTIFSKVTNSKLFEPMEDEFDREELVEEILDTGINEVVEPDSFERYVIRASFKNFWTSPMPFDMQHLSPGSIYVYTDFIDESHVNGGKRRLLAILDTSAAYDKGGNSSKDSPLLLLYNKQPIIAHIYSDKLQFMHFALETKLRRSIPIFLL